MSGAVLLAGRGSRQVPAQTPSRGDYLYEHEWGAGGGRMAGWKLGGTVWVGWAERGWERGGGEASSGGSAPPGWE